MRNRRIAIIFGFQLICTALIAQVPGQYERLSFASTKDSTLFDHSEIKIRNIKRVFIIDSLVNAEAHRYLDTLMIYEFDSRGKIIREIDFRYNERESDYHFDMQGNIMTEKDSLPFIVIIKPNKDSVVRKFEIYKPLGKSPDTSITYMYVYDKTKRLIEFEKRPSDEYKKSAYCKVRLTLHWKYNYDEQGRVISYSDNDIMQTYKYTMFGKTVETVDLKSKKTLNEEAFIITKDRDSGITSEVSKESLIIFYPDYEKNSKLIGRVTSIPDFYIGVIHLIDFKYSEK